MKSMTRKAICILLAILLLFGAMNVGVLAESGALLGDVDGDGSITSTDARLILQYYANKITAADLDTAVADVDGDGHITSTDARLVLQYYAGKIPFFPALTPPTYDGYPMVPDFGVIYGVPEAHRALEEDGLYVEYSYEEIEQADNGQGILDEYAWLLEAGFGFALFDVTKNWEGVPFVWYTSDDESVFVAIGLWEDKCSIRIYDRLPFRYSLPAYDGYARVPDFGALYGVPEANRVCDEEGLYVEYSHKDINRFEEDIVEAYMALLTGELGFRDFNPVDNDEGGTDYFSETADHLHIVVLRQLAEGWAVQIYSAHDYPTYPGFPEVIDFGTLHEVREATRRQEKDSLTVVYAYEDIVQTHPSGEVVALYVEGLMWYGFELVDASNDDSQTTFWFVHTYGEVTVSISLQEEHMEIYMCRDV